MDTDGSSDGSTTRHPSRAMPTRWTAVKYGALLLGIGVVIASPAACTLLYAEPRPTKEEHALECPRLQSVLYQRYRLSRDPNEQMNVIVQLSGPEGELAAAHGLQVRTRLPGLVAGSAPVSSLCMLSNAPQVWHVIWDSPPDLN
jgi:hypothetical protein